MDEGRSLAQEDGSLGRRIFVRKFPPISRHTLALFCGASGDHNPVHVDIDFARASGFDDVFAHGMLTMAYLGHALEQAGPPEGIRVFSTRFSSITQLGAEITCEAHVQDANEDEIILSLTAKDQHGDAKLHGSAKVDAKLWARTINSAMAPDQP